MPKVKCNMDCTHGTSGYCGLDDINIGDRGNCQNNTTCGNGGMPNTCNECLATMGHVRPSDCKESDCHYWRVN